MRISSHMNFIEILILITSDCVDHIIRLCDPLCQVKWTWLWVELRPDKWQWTRTQSLCTMKDAVCLCSYPHTAPQTVAMNLSSKSMYSERCCVSVQLSTHSPSDSGGAARPGNHGWEPRHPCHLSPQQQHQQHPCASPGHPHHSWLTRLHLLQCLIQFQPFWPRLCCRAPTTWVTQNPPRHPSCQRPAHPQRYPPNGKGQSSDLDRWEGVQFGIKASPAGGATCISISSDLGIGPWQPTRVWSPQSVATHCCCTVNKTVACGTSPVGT